MALDFTKRVAIYDPERDLFISRIHNDVDGTTMGFVWGALNEQNEIKVYGREIVLYIPEYVSIQEFLEGFQSQFYKTFVSSLTKDKIDRLLYVPVESANEKDDPLKFTVYRFDQAYR